ncbi:related to cellular myosin heavy chain, type a [Phialocephala subalpina]|uniref:Related to cellular myosin heavy chain, type a n=1 Tax=Phialocephala subalpina TaxID=576137 RepID=A0A1L7WTG8_9HELO|nr:related to cellular myosin heavy chain, type a [Phialocephala subalpina]
MSRSSFFRPSTNDQAPLLHQYTDSEHTSPISTSAKPISISMRDLSPRSPSPIFQSTYHDERSSQAASPSPPPSFYRAQNDDTEHRSANRDFASNTSLSPSPSRTKARRIQFSAPPPPIASTALLPPRSSSSSSRGRNGKGESIHVAALGSPGSRRTRVGAPIDPLLGLERRERAIQDELQELLDAQSAGLIAGFGGGAEAHDGASDAGSSTPTTRSLARSGNKERGGGIVPVRQPKRKVVGLRGARRGLLRDMRALVEVKNEEMGVLAEEIERRQIVIAKTDGFEKRIEENRSQLSGYSGAGGDDAGEGEGGGEEAMEIAELRTEEKAVENEIREMEDRLAQMKARRRWLGERIQEGMNRRDARLSSYRGALREVEAKAKEFLKRPPISASIVMGNEEGFYALPSSRRTLGMAKEWWNKEVTILAAREDEVEKEKAALEEGAQMWESSIKVVVEFEDDLRTQMASGDAKDVDMLRKQIEKMRVVIQKLRDTVRTAEDRGWNLLICAVGAELEAFKEGEGILLGALEALKAENGDGHDEHDDDGPPSSLTNGLGELAGQPLKTERLEREESASEDDGPNLAELMIDRGSGDDTS